MADTDIVDPRLPVDVAQQSFEALLDQPVPEGIPDVVQRSQAISRPDLVRINSTTGDVEEIATVEVNGKLFEDWETVWIQWNWNDWFSRFRFTCAELEPYPLPGQVMQFEPSDPVKIYLGGILVIQGFIISRQVQYDDKQHGIMLEGYSASWMAQRSSIDHKTSDFDGKNFLQIAAEILAPTGIGYETIGMIDPTPFKSGATPPTGATIGQFLESLARDRKIIVSNTPKGNFLFIGEHTFPTVGDLIEGRNIKKMQCIITDENARSMFNTKGQKQADDKSNMREAAEQEARKKGILKYYSIKTTAMEHPVGTPFEIARRNDTEKMWDEDLTRIEANVTVYGWFRERPSRLKSFALGAPSTALDEARSGHAIWQAGDEVVVISPMVMFNHQVLKIRTVTWTQDRQNGSQTVLQLVNSAGLNGAAPIARPKVDRSIPNTSAAETPSPATNPLIGPG